MIDRAPAVEPSGRPVVLADLDGTLVHSHRRIGGDRAALRVVERYQGRDSGFTTDRCWDSLVQLQALAELVPVTARVARQYHRIELPRPPRVAVIEAGARILVSGRPDVVWDRQVRQAVAATGVTPELVAERMEALDRAEDVRLGDVTLVYTRVLSERGVGPFARWCGERAWTAVRQGGRVYAFPAALGKAGAAVRAAELAGGHIVAAAGDGLMDADMLLLAEESFTPVEGPLWLSGWRSGTGVDGYGLESAGSIVEGCVAAVRRYLEQPPSNSEGGYT